MSSRLEASPIPQGRAAWAIYGLVAAVLALSSAAPFVRFGVGGPRFGREDLIAVLVYLFAWIPFIVLLLAHLGATANGGRGPFRPWVGHGVLLLAVPALHSLVFLGADTGLRGEPVVLTALASDLRFPVLTLLGTLQYLVVVAALYAGLAGRAADRHRILAAGLKLERARLEAQLTQARMDALRSQLHPHFLFNTLNSISVLTASDPDGARLMVRRLSELLRAVLADGEQLTVPLRRELEVLDAYVDIQRVRFGERLKVRTALDPEAVDWPVPPLLLQPLVENAIRHAVAEREEGGSLLISARVSGDRLTLTVVDDGPGPASTPEESVQEGVGLRNTRERLRQLYGVDHSLTVTRAPDTGCEVRIGLPRA